MRFLFRLIPLLLGLVTILAFAGISFGFAPLRFLVPGFFLVLAYGLFELFSRRVRERDFWSALVLLGIFTGTGIAFFLFLETAWAKILTVFLTAGLVTFTTEQLYRWFYVTARVPSYALGVSVSLLELFTVFLLASDFVGLRIFLRAPLWILVPGFIALIILIALFGRWARGLEKRKAVEIGLIGLLFGELFWAVLFLPSSFEVAGALIALAWYVIIGLLRVFESGLAVRRTAGRYAAVGAVLLIIIVFTARWT